MTLPAINMREMIEAGVHFGHKTRRWNPRMAPYLFGIRNDIHIIDLQQTAPLLKRALQTVRDVVAANGRVLFVGTKPQASEIVAEYAKRCGQYYVNNRWLGGMLTNWNTCSQSIKKLRKMDETLANPAGYTKNEILQITRERDKLEKNLGGIKDMGGIPDLIFVIDSNKEAIAIQEAKQLDISVISIVDSNSDPYGITYPVPGNDDSVRAIKLYCRLISDAVLGGIQESLSKSGVDLGESMTLPFSEAEAVKGPEKLLRIAESGEHAGQVVEVESAAQIIATKSIKKKSVVVQPTTTELPAEDAAEGKTKAKKPAKKSHKG